MPSLIGDHIYHQEEDGDEGALAEIVSRLEDKVELVEKIVANIAEEVLAIGRSGDYDLIVVGKGWCPSTMVVAPVAPEHPELGPIGDMLASLGQGIASSVLVVQQHVAEELPVSKIPRGKDEDGRRGHEQSLV